MGEGDKFPPKMEGLDESDAPTKKTARQLDFAGGSVEHSQANQAPATSISAAVATPIPPLQSQVRLP